MPSLANIGETLSSKPGKAMVLGGLFAAGALKTSYRSAVELNNQAAFGNDDADKFFMGEQGLSPSGLLDASTGSKAGVIGSIAGGIGGGALGLALGKRANKGANEMLGEAGKMLTKDVKIPEMIGKFKVPGIGGKTLLNAEIKGSMHGLGALGAIAGAAIGGTALLRGHLNRNKEFLSQSPYSRGSAMQAQSTQAYGDMVLGMHNSRRG
jgi:hypothetical protein